jgi:glycosyltransferase involved in cell wall biosynthesis
MRQLLPKRFYPGRDRVGDSLSSLELQPSIKRYDGVDWFWMPTLPRAIWFLARQRPQYVILQWWSGTVAHTYLALALAARALKTQVIVEFHEVLDTGEARLPWVKKYIDFIAPLIFKLAGKYVVHSQYDQQLVCQRYGLPQTETYVIPHATYDHYRARRPEGLRSDGVCNLLYFGVIRPFKGLEDLIRAFDSIPEDEIERYRLTVVGETWEGWQLPGELIGRSRFRDRITFVNRYVTDDEVGAFFQQADVVVLPYHRSSQSGPLHIAMDCGLPVVVTAVGGLVEAVEEYEGAVLAEPANPEALLGAIRAAARMCGQRYARPRTWSEIAARYRCLLSAPDGAEVAEAPSP